MVLGISVDSLFTLGKFKEEQKWWGKESDGFKSRKENTQAWKVDIKDIIDLDYINFTTQKSNVFTPNKNKLKKYVQELPSIKEPNFFYEQKDHDQFEDVSGIWSSATPSLSNGVAYADFDLDGDLDMVINNINSAAFLLENKTTEKLF